MTKGFIIRVFAIFALLGPAFNHPAEAQTNQYLINTIAGGVSENGSAATAIGLGSPEIAVDPTGTVYVASFYGSRVYKINANGTLTTVAGNGSQGYSGDGGPATSASLNFPNGIAVDSSGNVYIADTANNRIRKVTNGVITTFAGNGTAGFSGDNGPPTSASINNPVGLALDPTGGILYIADLLNNRIRKVANNVITTVAGDGTAGYSGDNGQATLAELNQPRRVALDLSGNIFIADTSNHRIREVVAATGVITTVAGNGTPGFSGDGGLATSAELNTPAGLAVDSGVGCASVCGSTQIYIADANNQRIRQFALGGSITTVVGNGTQGFSGDGGLATNAELNNPLSILEDNSGNFYIQDDGNNRVRKVISGMISTVAGGGSSGDGGPALGALVIDPYGVFVDSNGNVYIAETGNNRIRKIASGSITTIAGNGSTGYSGDLGPAISSTLNYPQTVVVDNAGDVFIADTQNSRIRKVTTGGVISTVAGNGTFGYSGDGGAATAAALNQPLGIALDNFGNLYIADTNNHRIREVVNGTITTVAGNGTNAFSGDNGPPTSASLSFPQTVAFDSANNLYILDSGNNRVRKVASNIINTVVGNGTYGFSGDGGAATSAELADPLGLTLDGSGNMFISDTYNQRIREVSGGIINTIAGTGTAGYSGDGASSTSANINHPVQVALDRTGNLFVADANNSRIRLLTPVFPVTVTTLPTGLDLVVDDQTLTAPQTFNWEEGSNHTIGVTSPQPAGTGIRYAFASWSDSGAITHTVTVPASSVTYTATFNTQYLLTTSIAPSTSGTITPNPVSSSSDGYYNSGVSVQLTASAIAGYLFANWSGALTGTTNPQSVLMIAPRNVVANFSLSCTYSLSSNSATVGTAGGNFSVGITAPAGCPWTATNSGNASWVGITSGASGSGNGTVGYAVQPNSLGGQRTTSLTVAGQAFILTQAGQGCLVGLTPSSISVPQTGGTGNVSVGLSGSDCAWTATSNVSWVTLTSGSSGTGNGTLNYTVSSDTTAGGRSGSITISPATGTAVVLPVQESGVTCTYSLPQASQGFASQGGPGTASITAPSGCTWTAQSTVDWITTTNSSGSGNGTVNYMVTQNPSSQPRSGALIFSESSASSQTYTVTEGGASPLTSPTCTASVPTVPQVALEGRTEVLGNLILSCSGITAPITADIVLTLNTNVSNILTGTSTTDAQLTVNGGTAQLGQILGAAAIHWPAVTLVAGVGGVATVQISQVRADASLLGPSQQAVAVAGQVNVNARVTVPVINAQQTLAMASPAVVFQIGAPSSGSVPLVFQEGRAGAFQAGTRLRVKLSNIPASVGTCAPINSQGVTQAQLYSADANGLGGSPVTGSGCQSMTISQGVATATWVILAADPTQIQTWTFPMQVTGASDLSQVQVTATLGPVSDVSASSATAPLPRYRDFSTPLNLVNLRLSTQLSVAPPSSTAAMQGAARGAVRIGRDSIAVGSNLTFLLQILNDTSDQSQTATGVMVEDNLPLGLIYQGCLPAAFCSVTGNVVQASFGTLGAGASQTLTVLAQVDPMLADGTVLTDLGTAFVGGNNQVLYDPRSGLASSSFTVGTSSMQLSPSTLNFGCSGGVATGPQAVAINFSGATGLNWTATATANITVNGAAQAAGAGNATLQIATSCGGSGSVTVTASGVANSPQQIQVTSPPPTTTTIIGSFDTPANNTTGVAGAVGVTGWALDSVEVTNVGIWREAVPQDGTAPNSLLFIGYANFVVGSRPDVATKYPNMPFNNRAGWGYQMLTNFLPNSGNGTYKLHAIATNLAGQTLDLGTRTITVDNTQSTSPFGTIDTPDQGGTATGNSFVNFGWALTPNPFSIPTNGSTIQVVVDSVVVGHPVYNQYRSDIASQFPHLANSNGAVGFYYIDTTQLANGVHTISWNVYDNVGHGSGLGSRYFTVQNTGGAAAPEEPPTVESLTGGVRLRSGYDLNAAPVALVPDTTGTYSVELEQLGRMELSLGATAGHMLVAGEAQPLPLGSSLKAGVFYWQPPLGFLGDYQLVFVRPDQVEVRVRIHVVPKTYVPHNVGR